MPVTMRRVVGAFSAVGLKAMSVAGGAVGVALEEAESAQAATPVTSLAATTGAMPATTSAVVLSQPMAQAAIPKTPCEVGKPPDYAVMPLPAQYLTGGTVDQGVDYAAPGGTQLCAMGDGKIIGEGINGFGPNAPILSISDGPLAGKTVYYGHAGADKVPVGAHVTAGQVISTVGAGIVGISTGPHLEIGFYPPAQSGAGKVMLNYINGEVGRNT